MPIGPKRGETRENPSRKFLRTHDSRKKKKAKQYNVSKVLRISPGNPLHKGSRASYKRKDMGGIADGLVALWEIAKNDSPVYQKYI